ncbi:MAG: IF-2-associated domain-containing protein [Burkholderiaceae bacterium]
MFSWSSFVPRALQGFAQRCVDRGGQGAVARVASAGTRRSRRAQAKITLTRKQTTEIKQADATGRARTIQVEVRKKRVFVKRDAAEMATEEGNAPVPELVPEQAILDEEQRVARLEEERRQQELLERQARSCARSKSDSREA